MLCFVLFNCIVSQAVSEVIRTCLGPKAMLKMILDPMGGICLTNDGNAILRVCWLHCFILCLFDCASVGVNVKWYFLCVIFEEM